MKKFYLNSTGIALVIIANMILSSVLESNAREGLYGTSDALIIPMGSAWIISTLISVFMLVSVGFASPVIWRAILSVLSGLPALALSILMAIDWYIPHHFGIVWAFGVLSAYLLYIFGYAISLPFNKVVLSPSAGTR